MRTNNIWFAASILFTMIALQLLYVTAVSAQGRPGTNNAIAHCGCDNKQGIEMYVQNLINDAKQRGMSCETAKMHTFACITSYCSICKEHPNLMENCIKNGAEYFASSGFCQATGQATGSISPALPY